MGLRNKTGGSDKMRGVWFILQVGTHFTYGKTDGGAQGYCMNLAKE